MSNTERLNQRSRVYVGVVTAAGALAACDSLYTLLVESPVTHHWFILAGLTLLSGSFTVRIPTISARLSVSETFVFAAVLLFGSAAATMIVVLETSVASFWLKGPSRRLSRVAFNMAAPAVAIWIASHVFYGLVGTEPLPRTPGTILAVLFPLAVLALLFFLLNSGLIAVAVGLQTGTSPLWVWRRNFLWLSLNYFSGASVAALLLPYLQQDYAQFGRVFGVLLPLLLISYLTFKTALGRVDDANRHLSELNRLYLSTIETLAMAIDAKDQITHGHIRRVQQFALGLARELGVTDSAQLKAIEAASLLHDMGKLAVPEYILNKPGPLTPAEFEKMKLHASVGADILSAIEFPYPVVPIVRHHHENWDGSGYPNGLRAAQIPIGARILSVVDCFDALTSDRPYRPRLPDGDAIRILNERRGSMYDPLIVDKFIEVHGRLTQTAATLLPEAKGLSEITRNTTALEPEPTGTRLDEISASREEMLVLYELARGLSGRLDLADAADVISKHLRRIVPASACVFYVYDQDSDELVAAHAAGENAEHFAGLRIPRGQRLTGWVAANRQTILNSDPVLDLGDVARVMQPRLRSCLSTPLLRNDELVGVLSVYSTHRDAFTEDHRRIAEVVGRQVSLTVKHAVQFHFERTKNLRDQLTGLPNLQHLKKFIASELGSGTTSAALSFILIDVDSLKTVNRRYGRHHGDRALGLVADGIRKVLRGADILFRYGSDEFVVLLTQTDFEAADVVAKRISQSVMAEHFHIGQEDVPLSVTIGVATAPADGVSVEDLIVAAKARGEAPAPPESPQRPRSVH